MVAVFCIVRYCLKTCTVVLCRAWIRVLVCARWLCVWAGRQCVSAQAGGVQPVGAGGWRARDALRRPAQPAAGDALHVKSLPAEARPRQETSPGAARRHRRRRTASRAEQEQQAEREVRRLASRSTVPLPLQNHTLRWLPLFCENVQPILGFLYHFVPNLFSTVATFYAAFQTPRVKKRSFQPL